MTTAILILIAADVVWPARQLETCSYRAYLGYISDITEAPLPPFPRARIMVPEWTKFIGPMPPNAPLPTAHTAKDTYETMRRRGQ